MNNLAIVAEPRNELFFEDFLPYRLSNLAYRLSKSIGIAFANQFGLSNSEWRVLVVLGQHPGLSAVEAAELALLDKVAVSRAVTRLVQDGRVHRQLADLDRRRSVLSLTKAGEELLEQLTPMALRLQDQLLDGLSSTDIAILKTVIDKLLLVSQTMFDDLHSPPQARRSLRQRSAVSGRSSRSISLKHAFLGFAS